MGPSRKCRFLFGQLWPLNTGLDSGRVDIGERQQAEVPQPSIVGLGLSLGFGRLLLSDISDGC